MIMRFNDLIISRKLQLSGNEMQLRRGLYPINYSESGFESS